MPARTPTPSSTREQVVWLGLRIPRTLDARLEAVAQREGNTKSAVIRRLLSAALTIEEETR